MTKLRIAENLSLPSEAVTQTFCILAKRGAGKTYTAAVMAEELLKAGLRVTIVDPIGVWWGLRAAADGKHEGLPITVLGGDHGDVPLEVTAGETIADLVVDESLSVVVDLSRFRKGEQTRFMTDFSERIYHRNRSPLHLILDEADAFAPQRPMKGQERMLGAVEDLVRRGRARGLGITLVTQRAAILNKDVLTQVEVLVCLRTIAPQDRDAVDAWIKVHGTPEQREQLMASLPSLPIGTAWFWSPGWLDVFQRVEVRRRETFDSSATPKVGDRPREPKKLAEVDLSKLRERIAATVERAKENDPKELRKKITELQKQVQAKAQAVPPDSKAIERAVEQARQQAEREWDRERKGLEREVARHVPKVFSDRNLGRHVLMFLRHENDTSAQAGFESVTAVESGPLPPGERAMLAALIQYPNGLKREQLTVLTGYKRSSRDAYLNRLQKKGYVVAAGETILPTDQGVAALPDAEPLPTGQALQDYWLSRLPTGEAAILEILIRAYPESVERLALDEATDYKRSSRDAYLRRLGAKELVEESGRGQVRASETLFD